jgi:hypothetical protein
MGPGRDAEGRPIPADVALLRRDPDIHGLDEAILRTIVYADVFDFPLTTAEVHRYLIGHPASASDVEERLARSGGLRKRLGTVSPFWFLAGREDLASVRREREAFAKNLWPEALRYGRRAVSLPFVRLVALTGSLAMNNVKSPDDDIDLLIITQSGRVWLARGLIVLLVRQARQRSVSLCPNYILSEHNLELSKPSLFVAHELAQMIPIHGSSRYQHLLDANSWLADFLPNASADMPVHATIRWTASLGRRGAEALLGGRLGDAVERWERERKIPRLRHEAAQLGGSGATFTPDLCKGHMADHATVVYRQYMAGLARQGL